jgi:glycosidase
LWPAVASPLVAVLCAHGGEPIRLENEALALAFDGESGAWTSLLDKKTGEQLALEPAAGVPAGLTLPRLDVKALDAAVAAGNALSAEGTWRFAEEPAGADTTKLAQPNFDDAAWQTTPVPSRADSGDRKLKDRRGTFWYRTTIAVPAAWAGKDLAIAIGAVDDFDTTYFNGQCVGRTPPGTPNHWNTPRRYLVPAAAVRAGQPNTLAVRVFNAAFDGGIAGPVRVGLASAVTLPAYDVKLVAYRADAAKHTLAMTLRAGTWLAHVTYELRPGAAIVARSFAIENAGDKPQTLRAAGHVLPVLSPGPDCAGIFPDSRPVGDVPLAQLAMDKPPEMTSHDGLIYLFSAKAGRGLGAWFHTEDEYATVAAAASGAGACITHNLGILAPLKPGEKAQLGTQYIWLAHGTRSDIVASVQRVYERIGLRAPDGMLPRLSESVMYCGHPGGMPEQGYIGYGGFKALQAYLPALKKMGVDLLWLLPIFEHGDGKKWNLYSPFDHFKISPLYGTPDELKALSAAAQAAGIRMMFDLVPHGPPDITPLAKEHPEWVCLDETGKPTYVWGQLAFDNAHAGWQDYMRRAAEFNAREYGIVGARIDVAAGSPPNWNPQAGYRPSFASLGGGLGMCRAIREGLQRANKGVVSLPEEYTGAHIFYRCSDLTYDAQLFMVFVDLQARNAVPAEWAATLQRFLHDQRLSLPPGGIKMRWTANHDTVSWTFQKQRTQRAYGPERARALLALCCLIDGVPMIYQGEEDPALYGGKGPSIVEVLARIIACRKRLPALARGAAEYDAVQASGGVFACLRTLDKERAIVLVSLNPAAVTSVVTLPEELRAVKAWTDELTGEPCDPAAVRMANHQVRVLVGK